MKRHILIGFIAAHVFATGTAYGQVPAPKPAGLATATPALVQGDLAPEPDPQSLSPTLILKEPELRKCAAPTHTVIVTDDPYKTALKTTGMLRDLRMQPATDYLRNAAQKSGCFTLMDPDPLLLALPGASMPDVILRIRPNAYDLFEKSLVNKADEYVRNYVGGYVNWFSSNKEQAVPLLGSVSVSIAVLCPKQRRVIRELTLVDDTPNLEPSVATNGASLSFVQNSHRMRRVTASAHNQVVEALQSGSLKCE